MNVFGGGRRSGIERDIIAENKQTYIVFIIKKKKKNLDYSARTKALFAVYLNMRKYTAVTKMVMGIRREEDGCLKVN